MSDLKQYLDLIPADVKLFLKGLLAAGLNAATVFAFGYLTNPLNYTAEGFQGAWGGLVGAVVAGLALYFRKSPVPEWRWDRAVEKGLPLPERRQSAGRGEMDDTPGPV